MLKGVRPSTASGAAVSNKKANELQMQDTRFMS